MRHLLAIPLALLFCGVCSIPLRASEGFDELAKLALTGASDDANEAKISASPIAYDLSVAEILRLNELRVSRPVIAAAVNHGRQKRGEPLQKSDAPASPGYASLLKLVNAGIDEEVVLGFIRSVPIPYDLSIDELLTLGKMGASVKALECAVNVGKNVRTLGPETANEAVVAMDRLNLRGLIKAEPKTQLLVKNKSGKDLTLNKWTQDDFTVFMLIENKKPLKTVVAIASTTSVAEYKTEEYKLEVAPQKTVETNGRTETIPAVFEIRIRQICIAPETIAYQLPNKTVLTQAIHYEHVDGDKGAYKFKQGTVTVGKDEYEIVEMRDGGK